MYILEKLKDNCIWQGLYVQKYYIDTQAVKVYSFVQYYFRRYNDILMIKLYLPKQLQ